MGEKSCNHCDWAFGNACTAPIDVDCDEKTLVAWKPSPVVFDEEMRSEELIRKARWHERIAKKLYQAYWKLRKHAPAWKTTPDGRNVRCIFCGRLNR